MQWERIGRMTSPDWWVRMGLGAEESAYSDCMSRQDGVDSAADPATPSAHPHHNSWKLIHGTVKTGRFVSSWFPHWSDAPRFVQFSSQSPMLLLIFGTFTTTIVILSLGTNRVKYIIGTTYGRETRKIIRPLDHFWGNFLNVTLS